MNSKNTEEVFIGTLPFIIASEKLKHLGINPIKQVTDFYNENLKSQNKMEKSMEIESCLVPMDWLN